MQLIETDSQRSHPSQYAYTIFLTHKISVTKMVHQLQFNLMQSFSALIKSDLIDA